MEGVVTGELCKKFPLTQFDHHANRHMRTWGPQSWSSGSAHPLRVRGSIENFLSMVALILNHNPVTSSSLLAYFRPYGN